MKMRVMLVPHNRKKIMQTHNRLQQGVVALRRSVANRHLAAHYPPGSTRK